MTPKIKNVIIFVAILAIFASIYFFYIKGDKNKANLVSSTSPVSSLPDSSVSTQNSSATIAKDFLSLLVNVKSIKLDNSIFEDSVFTTLSDSSIILTPDEIKGRLNPFAPFGADNSGSSQITTGIIEIKAGTKTSPAH